MCEKIFRKNFSADNGLSVFAFRFCADADNSLLRNAQRDAEKISSALLRNLDGQQKMNVKIFRARYKNALTENAVEVQKKFYII